MFLHGLQPYSHQTTAHKHAAECAWLGLAAYFLLTSEPHAKQYLLAHACRPSESVGPIGYSVYLSLTACHALKGCNLFEAVL